MKKFKQIASLISSNEKLGIKEIDKMYKMYQTKWISFLSVCSFLQTGSVKQTRRKHASGRFGGYRNFR